MQEIMDAEIQELKTIILIGGIPVLTFWIALFIATFFNDPWAGWLAVMAMIFVASCVSIVLILNRVIKILLEWKRK